MTRPSFTWRYSILLSAPSRKTYFWLWSVLTARSSIRTAVYSLLPSSCTRANKPGMYKPVLVLQHRAGADGAGLRIQLVVHEVHRALVREALLVGQPDLHGIGRVARTRPLTGPGQLV